jgi:hypothetical protein
MYDSLVRLRAQRCCSTASGSVRVRCRSTTTRLPDVARPDRRLDVPQILIDDRPIGGYTELCTSNARAGSTICSRRSRSEDLTVRAVPRSAPGGANLVDRRAATDARLAGPVYLEAFLRSRSTRRAAGSRAVSSLVGAHRLAMTRERLGTRRGFPPGSARWQASADGPSPSTALRPHRCSRHRQRSAGRAGPP